VEPGMTGDDFSIWYPGKDDALIREHLGAPDWPTFLPEPDGPRFVPAPPPTVGPAHEWAEQEQQGKTPFSFGGAAAVNVFRVGKDVNEFGEIALRFGMGPDGGFARYSKNMVKNGKWWQWKSLRFEGNATFRKMMRPPMKDGKKLLSMHGQSINAHSPSAQKLKMGVFSANGLWKGVKSEFKWQLIGITAELIWKIGEALFTDKGWQPFRDYVFTGPLLWDLSKAAVKAVFVPLVTTAVTTIVTAIGSVAIIPVAVGLVVSVGVDCAVDELMGDQSMCSAVWDWATKKSEKPPPAPPQPPVLKPDPPVPPQNPVPAVPVVPTLPNTPMT
jgi:hypothetical protein